MVLVGIDEGKCHKASRGLRRNVAGYALNTKVRSIRLRDTELGSIHLYTDVGMHPQK